MNVSATSMRLPVLDMNMSGKTRVYRANPMRTVLKHLQIPGIMHSKRKNEESRSLTWIKVWDLAKKWKNLRREVTTGESVESGNGESTENGKRIMGPKDPIYSDDVEYQTSPRATTKFLSSTHCSQRNDDPIIIGWRHSSRKIPRVLDRCAR